MDARFLESDSEEEGKPAHISWLMIVIELYLGALILDAWRNLRTPLLLWWFLKENNPTLLCQYIVYIGGCVFLNVYVAKVFVIAEWDVLGW